MASRKPSLDLEKELTCSICTELLYQPLTLLDCLHTFCGACLKEWFRFQAAKIENAPTTPSPDDILFTCPSCRSSVRDTRRNATVVTLLEMYIAANPTKARSEAEKGEMAAKYTPGDQVIPKIEVRERTSRERRADEEDRRLLDAVREMSLREATPRLASAETSRQQRQSRSVDTRSSFTRQQSSDSRHRGAHGVSSNHSRHEGTDRRDSEDSIRRRDWLSRRGRSGSRQRQVEHQASLRSLLGSSVMTERDIEREIEDFARQIQEEGLLDGLDLDNIDLTRDDELSRRITEAYRRRQRGRSRNEASRRHLPGNHSAVARSHDATQPIARLRVLEDGQRSRPGARSVSAGGQTEAESMQMSPVLANLEVRETAGRPRRRTASGGRSATTPILPSATDTRPAARSQTDLTLRSRTSDSVFSDSRLNDDSGAALLQSPGSAPAGIVNSPPAPSEHNASFASRAPRWHPDSPNTTPTSLTRGTALARNSRSHLPAELAVVQSAVSSPFSSPGTSPGRRTRPQLYPEPAISCHRCNRQHIEYEVHYNCSICAGGQWHICLTCYRTGKGCRHWFGFGYGAWSKWEKMRQEGDDQLPRPHMLTACRYLPPPSTPGGADGRKTLTTNDPRRRYQTGTFCARCLAWTNGCYWRCDLCNEGDWGFCNQCVNQGNCCTHMLLPLTHEDAEALSGSTNTPVPGRPPMANIDTGPHANSIGSFKPLIFRIKCDLCQKPIPSSQTRHHCFSCTSHLVSDALPGDYDICILCYDGLMSTGQISVENGRSGWRRCPNGHRMAIIGFVKGQGGTWRYVEQDMVGGRALRFESSDGLGQNGQMLQKWTWVKGQEKWSRLATKDVAATAPSSVGTMSLARTFPPNGGLGSRGSARWAWYPQADADDELLFPKGAEIREVEDVNGDWFSGTYMGAKGLFPAPYVRLAQES